MEFEVSVLAKTKCKCGDMHFDFKLDGESIGYGRCGIVAENRFALKISKAISEAIENYNVIQVKEIIHSTLTQYVALSGKDYRSTDRMFDIIQINPGLTALCLDVQLFTEQHDL